MCPERDQIMPLWSPLMKRMKNFSSLRKLRNKKQSLRNRRRIHPVTPDFVIYNCISEDVEERLVRHRKIVEPEVIGERDSEVEGGDAWCVEWEDSSEEEEGEIDDEEIEQHCGMIRQRAQERKDEEMEVMEVEDEGHSEEDSESESEEYTDSEDDMEHRLKPVFIRKKDRVTVQEREAGALRQKELEQEVKHVSEEWQKYTLKIVEETKS